MRWQLSLINCSKNEHTYYASSGNYSNTILNLILHLLYKVLIHYYEESEVFFSTSFRWRQTISSPVTLLR